MLHLLIVVEDKIKKLEEQFSNLKEKLLSEIKANKDVTAETLVDSLAMLPTLLQAEYRKYIMENLSTLTAAVSVRMVFIHISVQFTFIDYGLLEYLVKKFGSEELKQDMSAYVAAVQVFLDETTVQQLMDHWPGQSDTPTHFEELRAVINKNANTYSLRQLDELRKKLCSKFRLSEVAFGLKGVREENSFVILWLVPSVLVPGMVGSAAEIDNTVFQQEHICSVTVNKQHLYLSVRMRQKKVRCMRCHLQSSL